MPKLKKLLLSIDEFEKGDIVLNRTKEYLFLVYKIRKCKCCHLCNQTKWIKIIKLNCMNKSKDSKDNIQGKRIVYRFN